MKRDYDQNVRAGDRRDGTIPCGNKTNLGKAKVSMLLFVCRKKNNKVLCFSLIHVIESVLLCSVFVSQKHLNVPVPYIYIYTTCYFTISLCYVNSSWLSPPALISWRVIHFYSTPILPSFCLIAPERLLPIHTCMNMYDALWLLWSRTGHDESLP